MVYSAALISMAMLAAILAIGGGLMVLARQKVVVDEEGHVSQIEIPFFGKLSTNYPSLVAIVGGIALAYGVQARLVVDPVVAKIPLSADVTLEGFAPNELIFVAAVPQRFQSSASTQGGTEALHKAVLEVDEPGPYTVIAYSVADRQGTQVLYNVVQGRANFDEDGNLRYSGRLRAALGGELE